MLDSEFLEDRPTKTGRSPFRAAIVTMLIGALWIVGGCNDRGLTDVVTVVNNTDQVVHFEIVTVQGTPFQLSKTANPGETVGLFEGGLLSDGAGFMRDRCTVGELRAIDPDGRVLQRFAPPICAPSNVVIGGGPGSS